MRGAFIACVRIHIVSITQRRMSTLKPQSINHFFVVQLAIFRGVSFGSLLSSTTTGFHTSLYLSARHVDSVQKTLLL